MFKCFVHSYVHTIHTSACYFVMLRCDVDITQVDETRRQQRYCNLVSEAMHYVSHAYHSISDMMVNCNSPPPRHLHAPPAPRPTIIQQAIPIQVCGAV